MVQIHFLSVPTDVLPTIFFFLGPLSTYTFLSSTFRLAFPRRERGIKFFDVDFGGNANANSEMTKLRNMLLHCHIVYDVLMLPKGSEKPKNGRGREAASAPPRRSARVASKPSLLRLLQFIDSYYFAVDDVFTQLFLLISPPYGFPSGVCDRVRSILRSFVNHWGQFPFLCPHSEFPVRQVPIADFWAIHDYTPVGRYPPGNEGIVEWTKVLKLFVSFESPDAITPTVLREHWLTRTDSGGWTVAHHLAAKGAIVPFESILKLCKIELNEGKWRVRNPSLLKLVQVALKIEATQNARAGVGGGVVRYSNAMKDRSATAAEWARHYQEHWLNVGSSKLYKDLGLGSTLKAQAIKNHKFYEMTANFMEAVIALDTDDPNSLLM